MTLSPSTVQSPLALTYEQPLPSTSGGDLPQPGANYFRPATPPKTKQYGKDHAAHFAGMSIIILLQ